MPTRDEVVEAINKVASERDGTLTLRCADAFALAEELSTRVGEIGELCNRNGIKIVQCQLGCFR